MKKWSEMAHFNKMELVGWDEGSYQSKQVLVTP